VGLKNYFCTVMNRKENNKNWNFLKIYISYDFYDQILFKELKSIRKVLTIESKYNFMHDIELFEDI